MADTTIRTALVTGANSGLGFEAAAQFADAGYARVFVTARTDAKAEAARKDLAARTGLKVFEPLTLELDDLDSVSSAAQRIVDAGGHIDVLLLNAGIAPSKDLVKTQDGIEATVAATLIGHHVLTMRLLESGTLSDHARIIIAGSEAARGDVPMFNPADVDALAAEEFSGDREAAIEALMMMEPPIKYHSGNQYATVKLFAAWWAAELARKLPEGMTVNAVSPGSTPGTNADRSAPFFMKKVLMPVFKIVPGMSHTVQDGAGRYLEAAEFGPDQTGKFYASKPKKMTGPLHQIEMDHFDNPEAQRALWNPTSKVSGGVNYSA
jgi:NAD(P)-dependent dehydrogenase (short-subunit alcohol dehydrogenase family)